MSLYKQPLLHFLLLGGLLFIVSLYVDNKASDPGVLVSRASFLEFIQSRNRGIDVQSAEQLLQNLSPQQQQALLTKHLEEEVLYQEALKLGLDKKDYVIKQRLIQKMDYLLEEPKTAEVSVSSDQLDAYFQRNAQRYYAPPRLTFSQVFIADSGSEGRTRAETVLEQLNQQQIGFEQGNRFGDRFAYFSHYIDRDPELIAAHFGRGFADQLATLSPSRNIWQGPLRSDHGWHLLNLVAYQEGAIPELKTIVERVRQDLRRERKAQQRQQRLARLIESYAIELPVLTDTGQKQQ